MTGGFAGRARSLTVFPLVPMGSSYDAEIWLVHKKPDGTETVQQQSVRFRGAGTSFTFPPVQVAGPGGQIGIDITGSLQLLSRPGGRYDWASTRLLPGVGRSTTTIAVTRSGAAGRGGAAIGANPADTPSPLIVVSIARRVRRASPFIDTRGTTDMSIQIPEPNDVLSFELPALQKATEDLLKGHQFSVRLRITAVK